MSAIVVYHIGGGTDEIGPIECVREAGFELNLVTFEALDGQCISDEIGEADFYVNKQPLSSGLLPPNPAYVDETYHDFGVTWGQNTALDKVIRVRTTTIDVLAPSLTPPDVLSIDTQGAELRILRGASETLKNVLCVVAEIEFVPIYLGQNLFHEQMGFLRERGFRLMDLCSQQEWHHGRKFGKGFFTVAEAVWLREDYPNLTGVQVETLAKIAAGFGRMSYAMRLLEHVNGEVENEWLKSLWRFRDHPDLGRA